MKCILRSEKLIDENSPLPPLVVARILNGKIVQLIFANYDIL